jgi:hypothetical protein
MPDVDVLLSRIARANGFAAAMIDTAMRKRFQLMVAEFHRELDAIEEHLVCTENLIRVDDVLESPKLVE